jgi:LSD1 subclass zinc finger protein
VAPPPAEVGRVRPPGARGDGGSQQAPQSPPPEEPRPLPPEGKLACPNCGASLEYHPGVADLKCAYCDHVQHIPQDAGEIRELDFARFARQADVSEAVLSGQTSEKRCVACGATVQFAPEIATDQCPFCDSPLEPEPRAASPQMQPQGVLPFGIDQSQAENHFRQWVKSRWFAPNRFKRTAELHHIFGLYVPHWTYDAMTWSYYTGQRGTVYYVTVGSGKNRRRQRRVRWTPVSGRVDHFFNDVTVCGSKSLPRPLVDSLEPWGLTELKPFRPEYLKGFRTERYQLGSPEGFVMAREKMDQRIQSLIRSDIGGDEQRITDVNTHIDNVTFKLVLLPMWVSAYRYGAKVHQVVVNGRTGKVEGTRPYSAVKITLAVLAGLLALAAFIGFIMTNQ